MIRGRCEVIDDADEVRKGIVNLRLTKCEMIQYRVFKKVMTVICCSHVRL